MKEEAALGRRSGLSLSPSPSPSRLRRPNPSQLRGVGEVHLVCASLFSPFAVGLRVHSRTRIAGEAIHLIASAAVLDALLQSSSLSDAVPWTHLISTLPSLLPLPTHPDPCHPSRTATSRPSPALPPPDSSAVIAFTPCHKALTAWPYQSLNPSSRFHHLYAFHPPTQSIMRSRSGSAESASNKSNSPPPDAIQILVKISGGKSKQLHHHHHGIYPASLSCTDVCSTAIPLNVRPTNTISNVLEFLSASTNIPADARLLHSGHALEPSSTVAELNLQPSSTLQLLSPLRGGTAPTDPESSTDIAKDMTAVLQQQAEPAVSTATSGTATPITGSSTPAASTPSSSAPRKSNKPRCSKVGCKAAAQPIVGDCGFCQKRFCGKHRMLESHSCEGLDDARQADRDRNTAKLESDRTVMLRGL